MCCGYSFKRFLIRMQFQIRNIILSVHVESYRKLHSELRNTDTRVLFIITRIVTILSCSRYCFVEIVSIFFLFCFCFFLKSILHYRFITTLDSLNPNVVSRKEKRERLKSISRCVP